MYRVIRETTNDETSRSRNIIDVFFIKPCQHRKVNMPIRGLHPEQGLA